MVLKRVKRNTPEPGWVQLFNGKDLTGWKVRNDEREKWQVVGKSLVGKGPYAFLMWGKELADFHCRLELKVVAPGQASVDFRHVPDLCAQATVDSGLLTRRAGALLLYSKPNSRTLVPSSKAPDGWFTMDIIALGKKITIKVDGVTTAERTVAEMPDRGTLQLTVIDDGATVHVRKIEIKELPPEEPGWVQLFNGKDLDGWKGKLDEYMVKQGELRALPVQNEARMLWTASSYENYELRLQCRAAPHQMGDARRPSANLLLHVNKADSPKDMSYCLGVNLSDGSVPMISVGGQDAVGEKDVLQNAKAPKAGTWQDVKVVCQDKKVTIYCNGEKIFSGSKCVPSKGHIGLWAEEREAFFRNIEIKELPATP
jgi:hypothetical protein